MTFMGARQFRDKEVGGWGGPCSVQIRPSAPPCSAVHYSGFSETCFTLGISLAIGGCRMYTGGPGREGWGGRPGCAFDSVEPNLKSVHVSLYPVKIVHSFLWTPPHTSEMYSQKSRTFTYLRPPFVVGPLTFFAPGPRPILRQPIALPPKVADPDL